MKRIFKKLNQLINRRTENLKNEERPITVVDVGCRWGFADKFLGSNANIEIYGFDPDKEECQRLENQYASESIRLVPFALADKPGNKKLYITKEPACSSLYQPDELLVEKYPALDCAREVQQTTLLVSTLDIWAKESGVIFVDYLKIDTQGSELLVLKGAQNALKNIRFLEVEVEFNPIYKEQPLFSEVDLFLRKKNFVLWSFPNLVHYGVNGESDKLVAIGGVNFDFNRQDFEVRGGQLFWADAIYVHREIVDGVYEKPTSTKLMRDRDLARILGLVDLVSRIEARLAEKFQL